MTRILLIVSIFVAAVTAGCGPKQFRLTTPAVSAVRYQETANPLLFSIDDARSQPDKKFSTGRLAADILYNDAPVNELSFLANGISAEFASRGVKAELSQTPMYRINVKKFRSRNHRVSGYSPYVTFTTFRADVSVANQSMPVTAYFKNGKVPVWSFDEVVPHCYDEAMQAIISEITSKLNRMYTNYTAPDAKVAEIVAQIDTNYTKKSYLLVYDLAGTNNPAALPHIARYMKHEDFLMRQAAISSIGILGAVQYLPQLKEIYANGTAEERNIAVKSIGDMGTAEVLSFIRAEYANITGDSTKDTSLKEVMELYL